MQYFEFQVGHFEMRTGGSFVDLMLASAVSPVAANALHTQHLAIFWFGPAQTDPFGAGQSWPQTTPGIKGRVISVPQPLALLEPYYRIVKDEGPAYVWWIQPNTTAAHFSVLESGISTFPLGGMGAPPGEGPGNTTFEAAARMLRTARSESGKKAPGGTSPKTRRKT